MEFNGFEVSPVGNAHLTIEDNTLKVSGIGDTGLDGVLINADGVEKYTVNFGTLETISDNNGVLKISNLVRNPNGMVVSNFESFKWFDEQNDKVILGYNRSILPSSFQFVGKLSGENVFSISNPDLESPDTDFPVVAEPDALP